MKKFHWVSHLSFHLLITMLAVGLPLSASPISEPIPPSLLLPDSHTYFPLLKKLEKDKKIKLSAMAVILNGKNSGRVIASVHPYLHLIPASLSKIVPAAAALESLGSDFTFSTSLYSRNGDLSNGKLKGDLVFCGSGDPFLTNEKLWFLSTDVARRGIREIEGSIVVNSSLFSSLSSNKETNRSRGYFQSTHAYDSPLSSAAVNFSTMAVVVSPTQAGRPAALAMEPFSLPSFSLQGHVETTPIGTHPQISVKRMTSPQGKERVFVSGNIPEGGKTVRVYRSVSHPDQYTGEVIEAFLRHAGVKTSGRILIEKDRSCHEKEKIATIEGFPLDWQLRGLFRMSNNFIADMLTIDLSVLQEPKKNFLKHNIETGGQFLEEYLQKTIIHSRWSRLPQEKEETNERTYSSFTGGSGLSLASRLSAHDIISVLDRMYFNDREFPAYLAALPYPGGEGTLKTRFSRSSSFHLWEKVRAKTGTLTEPVPVVSLGGYLFFPQKTQVAFAIIINGTMPPPAGPDIMQIRKAMDADLEQILTSEPDKYDP